MGNANLTYSHVERYEIEVWRDFLVGTNQHEEDNMSHVITKSFHAQTTHIGVICDLAGTAVQLILHIIKEPL
jgi:hypothetical protein